MNALTFQFLPKSLPKTTKTDIWKFNSFLNISPGGSLGILEIYLNEDSIQYLSVGHFSVHAQHHGLRVPEH